jgi:hypothetical protein
MQIAAACYNTIHASQTGVEIENKEYRYELDAACE